MTNAVGEPVRPSWGQFACWALVGALAPATLLAAFTPLVVVPLPLIVALCVLLARRGAGNASALGVVAGAALGGSAVGALAGSGWAAFGVAAGGTLAAAAGFSLARRR